MLTSAPQTLSRSSIAATCILAVLASVQAFAAEHPVTMWQTEGQHNRIYILGSIHLLRASDYPIPPAIYSAYDDAETLIMELDMDDMDPLQTAAIVMELGMIKDGGTLEDKLGRTHYAKAVGLADELEIPLAMMAGSKPWLAAVTVETMILTRVGFDPSYGIEMHLTTRAVKDNKTVIGLETTRQQIEMLDGLSPRAQREMLMQTLTDGGQVEALLDEIIDAWRKGDIDYMEETLLSDMEGYRELYETIVVDRNKNWVRQIDALLDDDDDYLIVVGTMHLVGKDGVPELLRKRGLQVRQVTD